MLNNTVCYDTLIILAYLLYNSSFLAFLVTHYSFHSIMTIIIITINIREALSERIRLCPWEGEGGYAKEQRTLL